MGGTVQMIDCTITFGTLTTISGGTFNDPVLVSPVGCFSYSGTRVFSGTAPTSWTDRDLSSVVGSRRALVLLRVHNGGSSATNYRFRPNGAGWLPGYDADASPTIFSTRVLGGGDGFVWVMTDASGIIEWDADQASSTTLYVEAYIT